MARSISIDKEFSYFKYNLIALLKLMEIVPKKLFKFLIFGRDKQLKRYFWERLGFICCHSLKQISSSRPIWIHANSLGEVMAGRGLCKLIKEQNKSRKIILSTTNLSADKRAKALSFCDYTFFFPYDLPIIIQRVLDMFNPSSVVFIENDFWPNFLRICARRKVPLALISGRFSNLRYFYNYRFRLNERVFKYIDLFCLQSEKDAQQFRNCLSNWQKITVTGNLKFVQSENLPSEIEIEKLKNLLNLNENAQVFVAGSIHEGEDEIVLEAFLEIKRKFPLLCMIIAPRYLERVGPLQEIAKNKGLKSILRTELSSKRREDQDLLILDTMGELSKFYALSTVSFVGGSLVPQELMPLGSHCEGHNILEPAVFGKPVLFGPRMDNFRSLADLFLQEKVGGQVADAKELATGVSRLLISGERREEISQRLKLLFKNNSTILEKTLESLNNFWSDYES